LKSGINPTNQPTNQPTNTNQPTPTNQPTNQPTFILQYFITATIQTTEDRMVHACGTTPPPVFDSLAPTMQINYAATWGPSIGFSLTYRTASKTPFYFTDLPNCKLDFILFHWLTELQIRLHFILCHFFQILHTSAFD